MGGIHTLPGVEAVDQSAREQPQPELIEMLERLLVGARSGELQALAIVTVRSNGAISHSWNGASRGHTLEIAAGIACLEHRYHHEATALSESAPFRGDPA